MSTECGDAVSASQKEMTRSETVLATVTLRVKTITRRDGEQVFVCPSLGARADVVKDF
jgi:hypothetical protein